jgi:hypothetical protein
MTSISNLVEPIVAGYFYTNVYNSHNPDSKEIKGGFPIERLIDITSSLTKENNSNGMFGGSGGGISKESVKKQFSNYGVPIGLVYIKEQPVQSECLTFEHYEQIPHVDPIDETTYDTLIDLISYPTNSMKSKTYKNKTTTHKKTLKH